MSSELTAFKTVASNTSNDVFEIIDGIIDLHAHPTFCEMEANNLLEAAKELVSLTHLLTH